MNNEVVAKVNRFDCNIATKGCCIKQNFLLLTLITEQLLQATELRTFTHLINNVIRETFCNPLMTANSGQLDNATHNEQREPIGFCA